MNNKKTIIKQLNGNILSFEDNILSNVFQGDNDNDVATKGYVDSKIKDTLYIDTPTLLKSFENTNSFTFSIPKPEQYKYADVIIYICKNEDNLLKNFTGSVSYSTDSEIIFNDNSIYKGVIKTGVITPITLNRITKENTDLNVETFETGDYKIYIAGKLYG